MQHPIIEEVYRTGTINDENRKCFVRIRVPALGKQQVPIEWDVNVQSHSTYATHSSENEFGENGKTEQKNGEPMFVAKLVQGEYTHVLLVADETGDWGVKQGCTGDKTLCSILHYASTEDTLVLPSPQLLLIVDQTFPDINRKLDMINDQDALMKDTSQYNCVELIDEVDKWVNPEGAPGVSFLTKKACDDAAKTLQKVSNETIIDSKVFDCTRTSEQTAVFRFSALGGVKSYSTKSSCEVVASKELLERNAKLDLGYTDLSDFIDDDKKNYANEPIVYIVQRGGAGILKEINTEMEPENRDRIPSSWTNEEKIDALKISRPLTQMEEHLLLGISSFESEDKLVEAVRIPFAGALWLVKDDNTSTQDTFLFDDAMWCVDQPKTIADGIPYEVLHEGMMPYELMVDMQGNYPESCGRQHFDYDMGVCRYAQNGKFSLMGYDDGVSMPLACASDDPEKIAARHTMCKNRLDTFDTRSAALRHCETRGCSGILHRTDKLKSGDLLDKEWAAVTGVFQTEDQDHPFGLKSRPGIDSIVVSGIARDKLDEYVPIPLCGFCDRDGIPAAALPSKETCCKCGGGERRRFFSVPTRLMTNPLIPYLASRSVYPVTGGKGYNVGDVLTLRSDGVPAARGGKVRVTKVHMYKGVQISLEGYTDCEAACNDTVSKAIKPIGNDKCLCAKPGDSRLPGHITEVEIVSRGQDYESGAANYVAKGGSGTGASFHVNTVDLYGGMLGTESPTMLQLMKNIIVAGLGAAALGAGVAAVFLYRSKGAKIGFSVGGAGVVALLGAVVVFIVGNPKPTPVRKRPPVEQRANAKSSEVCAEGEHLVEGQCMNKEDVKAKLILNNAGFLQTERKGAMEVAQKTNEQKMSTMVEKLETINKQVAGRKK